MGTGVTRAVSAWGRVEATWSTGRQALGPGPSATGCAAHPAGATALRHPRSPAPCFPQMPSTTCRSRCATYSWAEICGHVAGLRPQLGRL
eukprot:9491910-Pyramimonas_sp.AAC.1